MALPFKLWKPRRFDGVALVVGSAVPDAYYALNGIVVVPPTHNLPGVFWFGLPVALAAAWIVRRAAPLVASHLPTKPAQLAMRDYTVLGRVKHPWWVIVYSALLGVASHVGWDGFTHDPGTPHGWGVRVASGLAAEPVPGLPWWQAGQHASTIMGAVAVAIMAVYIGRRRLLVVWHGEPPPQAPRRPWVFWPVAAVVAAAYPLSWPHLPYQYATYVQGVRMIWASALALAAGAATVVLVERVRAQRHRRRVPGARLHYRP